ncbi:MAG: hypothetical protein JWO78_2147 [Micavibrio sp.]|nr:hypothetical protein [Micavibrio sp.]
MKEAPPEIPLHLRLRLKFLRGMAATLIVAEKILEAFWPFLLWVCVFASLWLLQIPAMFGTAIEVIFAVVFFLGFMTLSYQAAFRLQLPRYNDVTRRIEDDSELRHRPLSNLDDRLANPAPGRTEELWSFWQRHLLPTLKLLRLPKPHAVMPQLDPFALRGAAVMVLIAAMVMAGPTWRLRISHGMLPVVPSFMKTDAETVVLWVTPPPYTGMPQMVLKGAGSRDKIFTLPEGSVIKARVSGWLGQPSLAFDHADYPMESLGKGNYGLEKIAEASATLTVKQMLLPRASWKIDFVPDKPPTISRKGEPQPQAKGEIKIPLTVQDDYGVETVTAHITLAPDTIAAPPIGTPVDDTRNVVSPPKVAMDFTPQFDLAWHPWAGMKVVMDLEAKDHKGQVAAIKGLTITLPERAFRHPLAQKMISLRKRLMWSPEASADNVGYELEQIMIRPSLYQGDKGIFLSLRSMSSHLIRNNTPEEVAKVVAQLWDTALHIEDGNFSVAQRDLRNAQNALQNALRDPKTTPAQIAQLMDDVRQAMMAYLKETFRELQKKMAENGGDPNALNPQNFMKMINPDALAAMLDKMQAQAMSGDRNAAQQMLSQMQKMMDALDPSNMSGEMPKDMQEMAEQVAQMQKLIEQQKALLEQTKKEEQPDKEASKAEQENIRKALTNLMSSAADKLGDVPEGMGKAELEMRGSTMALGDGKPVASVPHQEQAIKDLSEGQQQMSKKLGERMQQMMMFSFGQGRTDPLGRPMQEGENGQPGQGSKVKIPDQAERKKIQDILEQLRKKSGELARPDYELDYYHRLMRQF